MDFDFTLALAIFGSVLSVGSMISIVYLSKFYADHKEVEGLKDRIDNLEALMDSRMQNAITYIQTLNQELRNEFNDKRNKSIKVLPKRARRTKNDQVRKSS